MRVVSLSQVRHTGLPPLQRRAAAAYSSELDCFLAVHLVTAIGSHSPKQKRQLVRMGPCGNVLVRPCLLEDYKRRMVDKTLCQRTYQTFASPGETWCPRTHPGCSSGTRLSFGHLVPGTGYDTLETQYASLQRRPAAAYSSVLNCFLAAHLVIAIGSFSAKQERQSVRTGRCGKVLVGPCLLEDYKRRK